MIKAESRVLGFDYGLYAGIFTKYCLVLCTLYLCTYMVQPALTTPFILLSRRRRIPDFWRLKCFTYVLALTTLQQDKASRGGEVVQGGLDAR